MGYFTKAETAEDLKSMYFEYCKKLHPDNGGNAVEFVGMKTEYEEKWQKLKDIHEKADGTIYRDSKETDEVPEQFEHILEVLLLMNGIEIWLVGRWIWIDGDTKKHKEKLKELGFRWHSKLMKWSFHYGEYEKHYKRQYGWHEIMEMHETHEIRRRQRYKEIA